MRACNRQMVFFVWMAAMPVSAGLFRVWVHQDAVQMGYSLSSQEHRREGLRATERELEVELAAARSPVRLKQLAANLGLKAPAPGQLRGVTPLAHLAQADIGRRADGRP
jgi:hypothetical protein